MRASSCWKAATLSAVLFSLVHLANFSKGFSPQILLAVATSVAFGFVLTFPLCRLFEAGAGSILGGAVLHVAIDSINWFSRAGEPGPGLAVYLVAVAASAGAVMVGRVGLRTEPGSAAQSKFL